MLVIISLVAFVSIDLSFGSKTTFTGIVIDKRHQSESYRTGTSYVYTNKGTAMVTSSERTPEVYQLLVRTSSGEVVKVECDATLWYNKKLNEKVNCTSWIGYISKSSWLDRGIN
ncbi:hypothetical protein [Flavobacterium sp. 3-210]